MSVEILRGFLRKNISLSERFCGSYSTKKTRRCVGRLQSLSKTTLAQSAAVDPSPTATPTPRPSFFAAIHNNSNPPNNFHNFDENVQSGTAFQTPKRDAVKKFSNTHTCSETPNIGGAPRKRRPEKSLME